MPVVRVRVRPRAWGRGPEQASCTQRAPCLRLGLGLGLGFGLGLGLGLGLGVGLGLG